MSTKNPNMTKAQRREAARAEALALREKEQQRDKRNRIITLSVLAAALVALAVVVWFILREGEKKTVDEVPLSEVSMPATAQDDGGIPVGADRVAGSTNEGAPVVDVYLDYMCPVCGQFEQINAADIDTMIDDGDATVVYHPVTILDRLSQGTEYSTRSAAASAYVADQAPEAFAEYNALLFANQPAENSEGLTDEQLASYAEEAGADSSIADAIADGTARTTFGQYVYSATKEISDSVDRFGTPYVLVDGEVIGIQTWSEPGALADTVAAASSEG
ncbi:thioredoxin domain-containing protein [Isoptericola sp. BMS4]|uniref:DsbA family protein n=1 Tax=Isoptericola sp. BMS4 TaxID=2527875 RepID=UPI00141E6C07|nr:thioredoxin domain-containing protein [Isoptericola sp. BMS4]